MMTPRTGKLLLPKLQVAGGRTSATDALRAADPEDGSMEWQLHASLK